uniref:Uncharacterized protein n=1 Tax=Anopheles culicifacies TaxID=139723 RepID=A0A182MBB6_9DIPT
MSSRKSRLSLSKDLHKDKDARTPNARRTLERTAKTRKSPESQRNEECYEVSPSQSSQYSPLVSLTQDNSFHAINGVSWEWNSPQRMRDQKQVKIGAANNYNIPKPPLRTKYSDIPDKAATKKPTGFNKFISKLNLLMEKENLADPLNSPVSEPTEHSELPGETSCFIDEFFVESDAKQSVATTKNEDSDDDIFQEHVIDTPVKKGTPTGTELDDSKLDILLIEASQTIEQQHFNKPASPPPLPEHGTKAKANAPQLTTIPIEMNDSDMDGFLVQASLMVEEKLSDSSQDSSSNAQPTVNRPDVPATTTGFVQQSIPVPSNDADKRDTKSSASTSEGSSEITMSQDELKALIEMKRQEALRRLQNNRLKRGMKGTNSHGC